MTTISLSPKLVTLINVFTVEPGNQQQLLELLAHATEADAACCYFSAKNTDILQPAQKVFITWDPAEKIETFTVQPKFEGNA